MPHRYRRYGDQIRRLHPGWEVRDWRSPDELPNLVNGDLIARAAEFYPDDRWRFAADLFRLEILHRFGGVYIDCDVDVRRVLDGLRTAGTVTVGLNPRSPVPTNTVIATPPQHPFIGALLTAAPAAAERFRGQPLHNSVGPQMLHRTLQAAGWPDVAVLSYDEMFGGGGWVHHRWDAATRRRRTRWLRNPVRALAEDFAVWRRARFG